MRSNKLQYRADVDGLRGVAVLLVVVFHAFPTLLKGGFIGVDVFFVISGYLISKIIILGTERGEFSFPGFYGARLRRILPSLLVALLCCLAGGWIMLLPYDFARLGEHVAGGAAFISNFVLLSESGYFDSAADLKPLLHLWSLGIEEQFYAFWPLLLWTFCTRKWNTAVLPLLLGLASFSLNIEHIAAFPTSTFYLPQTRFWELMVGATLAIVSLKNRNLDRNDAGVRGNSFPTTFVATKFARNCLSTCGTLCLAGALLFVNEHSRFPGWWALLPTTGTALLIAAGPSSFLNRALLARPTLVWFGLISYPLYILHWPLIAFATLTHGEFPARGLRILLVGLSIVLAWLTYTVIEKPIRFQSYGRGTATALVLVLAFTGGVGYYCYSKEGFPDRWSPVIAQIDHFEHWYDHQSLWRERSCFLELDQGYEAFDTCDPGATKTDKGIIFIWGDSLAAQLYPGYQVVYGGRFSIVQRTASACAPLFDDAYNAQLSNCPAINDYTINLIRKIRPERVILAARWSVHDWKHLALTVAKLRDAGVSTIDLIGPFPRWKGSLPRQLILYLRETKAEVPPATMSFGLESGYQDLEPRLSEFAKRSGINYISPSHILCRNGECLTRTGVGVESLTTFDYDHLAGAGSVYLVSQLDLHE